MKTDNSKSDDRRLHDVLQAWAVRESLPPRFGERVWQRIARAEAWEPAGLWSQFFLWFDQVMTRPSLALSYVTVLLAVGLAAGYWHARVDNAQTAGQLGARYVQMMDPYRMPR
jgi:hypothetical protein